MNLSRKTSIVPHFFGPSPTRLFPLTFPRVRLRVLSPAGICNAVEFATLHKHCAELTVSALKRAHAVSTYARRRAMHIEPLIVITARSRKVFQCDCRV